MATSKELLKSQENGAEIRITIYGEPTGGLVQYAPRHKGDRHAWVYTASDGKEYRYQARDCSAAPAPVVEETPEPVAETACICPAPVDADHSHEWSCPRRTTETPENREDDMNERRKTEGPLTPTQRRILDSLSSGRRQTEIALELRKSTQYVSGEVAIIVGKMGARTTVEAVRIYGQAIAYKRAADELRAATIPEPSGPEEKHVNHVLTAIAQLYQGWHDVRMPE